MDILIVDDEPLARARLRKLMADNTQLNIISEVDCGEEARVAVQRFDPDVVLLDIQMPDCSGIELAEQLMALDDPPVVIICSAFDDHALAAFRAQVFDYLLKPVSGEQLLSSIERAARLNRLQKQEKNKKDRRNHIRARDHQGVKVIPIEDICCLLADQKYVTVVMETGEVLIDEPLKQLESEFGESLIRTHRNALVAVNKIRGLQKDEQGHFVVSLEGTQRQPLVSRRHMSEVKALLQSF